MQRDRHAWRLCRLCKKRLWNCSLHVFIQLTLLIFCHGFSYAERKKILRKIVSLIWRRCQLEVLGYRDPPFTCEKRWHPRTRGGTLLAQELAFISFWVTLSLESVLLKSAAPAEVLPIQFEVFLILCFYKSLHRGWLISHAHTFTLSHLEPQY